MLVESLRANRPTMVVEDNPSFFKLIEKAGSPNPVTIYAVDAEGKISSAPKSTAITRILQCEEPPSTSAQPRR